MKYITNLSNNPHYNLAFEEYCFKNLPREEDYVILWINGPAIIVGKNQNTVGEINQRYVEKNNIQIVRRVTGGGAVYHDLGNLNFSLISNQKGDEKIDFKEINVPILKSQQICTQVAHGQERTGHRHRMAADSRRRPREHPNRKW